MQVKIEKKQDTYTRVTKEEYHQNKKSGNYFCVPIYYPNLKIFGGYTYYRKPN